MLFGTTGRILKVDLNKETIDTEMLDEAFYRLYPGGKALTGYYLLTEMNAGVDPLGPDNVLVIASGLLTGSPFSTATRFTTAAKSPLTGGYGESEAGGFWGPELKFAGYEAIIIKGQAKHPVYLSIVDSEVEIRDAKHLWGHDPDIVQEQIRSEMGDKRVRVLQIGLGGENLVRFAAITNELRHFNGRCGIGAVMGSKKLKAVAVRGHQRYMDLAFDKNTLMALGRELAKTLDDHPQSFSLKEKGTPGLTDGLNAAGILPTKNFRLGSFEGIDKISWEAYLKEIFIARRSCFACAVNCKREVGFDDRFQVKDIYGGPEYEAVASFGSDCYVADIQAIAKANELCNRYTLDVISTGAAIAFAMECYERGLITLADTGGLDLRWGNIEAILQAIELIAHRQGFGEILAEGSKRAAERIGKNAIEYSMVVKGQEIPMHEPRGKPAVGLGYAVSDTGADHLTSTHDTLYQAADSPSFQGIQPLGITEPIPAKELSPRKARAYYQLERWHTYEKVVGLCYFGPTPRAWIQVEDILTAVKAASGWQDYTLDELLKTGERAINLARVFNVREGFSSKDDALPERFFTPLEGGPLAGHALTKEDWHAAMNELYRCKGWDVASGAPTRQRLEELELGWAADLIGAK